jgi:DNA-binding IclR family transcriptional regulator
MGSINHLIDEKLLKILSVLYTNKENFYHLTQLASESKVPAATTFRLIQRLAESQLIIIARVGKLKIYRFNTNEQNEKIMQMIQTG